MKQKNSRNGEATSRGATGLSRREFLQGVVGAVTASALGAAFAASGSGARASAPQGLPAASQDASTELSLGDRALAKGLLYGAAVVQSHMANDSLFAQHVADECTALVPETALKWSVLRPSRDRYDFRQGDWLADFAQQRRMTFRGHTLVWHDAIPGWLPGAIDSKNGMRLMTDHITNVVTHYAGRVHSWDVVNEAIRPWDGKPQNLRESLWLNNCGPDYVAEAFLAAAAADPGASLVYNEYGLDYTIDKDKAKRMAVLELLADLKARNVPIHGLGIQAHLQADRMKQIFDPRELQEFVRDVAALGLKVLITELEVSDLEVPGDVETRDRAVAEGYKSYLDTVLQEPNVSMVLTWGLSDRYTRLSHSNPRPDKSPPRPLPLDEKMRRKRAWQAIADSFDDAPSRLVRHSTPFHMVRI